jgi:hypothetical protein
MHIHNQQLARGKAIYFWRATPGIDNCYLYQCWPFIFADSIHKLLLFVSKICITFKQKLTKIVVNWHTIIMKFVQNFIKKNMIDD